MQIKWAYLLTFVLCLLLPLQSFTVHAENLSDLPKDTLVLYTDSDSEIDLYVDSSMEESIVILPTGTKVLFDEQESETISKVRISMEHITNLEEYDEEVLANNTILVNDVEQLEGYVYSDLIVSSSDIFDQYVSEESEEDMADNQPHEEQSESSVTIEDSEESSQNNTNDITDETIQEQEPVKQVETETQIESETFHTPAMLTVQSVNYKSISRLGHIRNRDVQIFKTPGGKDYIKAGAQYTNAVYYIKREAVVNKDTYYLLSTSPSATRGVVGWAKASDLSTHPHVGVDKTPKIFGIKGNGKATTKAWGGSKDTVHASLSSLKGKTLHVNLTEKVGKNTWYRGKIDGKGSNVWVHSSYVDSAKESNTSRLGHIRNRNVQIFKQLGGPSFTAGSKYTNAVYYIKRQATVGSETFYLLSKSPSATKGVVGWAKASDLSTHPHVGVDKTPKIFGIKGNGKATSKAWGGSKDTVHASLSSLKGKTLHVNLTERVGNNTWYRGKIDGKGSNVWVHSSYVDSAKESNTSRLGHIRNGNVQIFKQLGGPSFTAGSKYTNAVYYIKRQASVGSEIFYLLSTSPSATRGVVGWAKASDLSTHSHVGVDKVTKNLEINGKGKATTKAWGGSKDTVYANMSAHKGKSFVVNLTEKVGNNIWYRGKINGRGSNIWLHSNHVSKSSAKIIVIDAGHGGKDGGASANGLREKDLTLDISKRVERLLVNAGYTVIMTRTNDSNLTLSQRSKIANDANADLFISIHINAGGGRGIETWWNDKNSNPKESEQLAKDVQSEIIKSTKASDRGVKGRGPNRGNFHVTREPKMPSALVEVGFIDTKSDADKLKDKNFLQRAAEGIANGIKKFLS